MRIFRAALGLADALVGVALLLLAGLAAAMGGEAWRDPVHRPADVATAFFFAAALSFVGLTALLSGWALLPRSAAGPRTHRLGRTGSAASLVLLALLSLWALFSGDTLTGLLLVVTVPPAVLLTVTWLVLRRMNF